MAWVAGISAPSLPQATAVVASLAMGLNLSLEALGHLRPSLNSLCCSTWCTRMEYTGVGPSEQQHSSPSLSLSEGGALDLL